MVNDNDDDGGRCIGNEVIIGTDDPSLLSSISSPKNNDANDGLNVLDGGGGGGGGCHGIGDGAAAVAGDGGGGCGDDNDGADSFNRLGVDDDTDDGKS